MLNSQGLFLATAMAVSAGTVFLFDLFRYKYFPSSQNQESPASDEKQVLKSCLSSGSKKREKEQKKRVQFADGVENSKAKLCREEHRTCVEIQTSSCGNEIPGFKKMPANRVALYSGILRDRLERMEYSY